MVSTATANAARNGCPVAAKRRFPACCRQSRLGTVIVSAPRGLGEVVIHVAARQACCRRAGTCRRGHSYSPATSSTCSDTTCFYVLRLALSEPCSLRPGAGTQEGVRAQIPRAAV